MFIRGCMCQLCSATSKCTLTVTLLSTVAIRIMNSQPLMATASTKTAHRPTSSVATVIETSGWQQNSRWLACSICSCHFTCPAEHMVHCSSVQCVMACWVASASLTQFLHCTFCVKYFLQPEIVLSHILKTVLCMQILHVLACSDSPQNAWHYHGGSCLSTCRKFCNCDYDFC